MRSHGFGVAVGDVKAETVRAEAGEARQGDRGRGAADRRIAGSRSVALGRKHLDVGRSD